MARDGIILHLSNPFSSDTTSGVIEPESESLYLQAAPNPFSQHTKIEFSVSRPSYVRITISNINGQQIETLISTMVTAGEYGVSWNSENVPSGVYLCRLEVQEPRGHSRSSLRQLVVVK